MVSIAKGRVRPSAYAILIALVLGFVVATAPTAWAQTVEINPPSQEPGGSVTFFGSGWAPGETVTVQFGGSTIATATADDAGNWEASGTIPEGMPAGQHPMDFNGDQGSTFGADYEVTAPPEPDEPEEPQEPEETATEGEAEEPDEGAGGKKDKTPRAEPDGAATKEDDGGFPAWAWILIVAIIAIALVGGWAVATRRGDTGTFVDAGGRQWEYCEARACRVEQQTVTDTEGRRVIARCVALSGKCEGSGCGCVLFIERGNNPPRRADLNEEGWYVLKPGETPSCRCIKD